MPVLSFTRYGPDTSFTHQSRHIVTPRTAWVASRSPMPWSETSTMDQKRLFIKDYIRGTFTMAELGRVDQGRC